MSSRGFILGITLAAVSAPAIAAEPPPVRTPQDAIAAVKKVLNKNDRACNLDWSRADASGYAGNWKIDVTVRASRAGAGVAKWGIGDGYPVARNKLAKAIAHRCRS